jgi:hypothetical protein
MAIRFARVAGGFALVPNCAPSQMASAVLYALYSQARHVMLSRIFWVGIAGLALVTGMVLQDGDWIFGGNDRSIDASVDRAVDRTVDRAADRNDRAVDRAVDRTVDRMQIVSDGREIDVPAETKRELAAAVGRLVQAEADHAILRIGDGSSAELQAATVRRDRARADIDRLKAEIKDAEQAARLEHQAVRDQIRREVREDVRDTVREAVRN